MKFPGSLSHARTDAFSPPSRASRTTSAIVRSTEHVRYPSGGSGAACAERRDCRVRPAAWRADGARAEADALAGPYRLVYCSPERLLGAVRLQKIDIAGTTGEL